ncbi:MAG: NAD-dependent epimerase/dehydratase family protein [Thermoplasmata archaeon]
MKNRKVLITGGAGFIGSHMVEKLQEDNDVTVFDNLSTGKLEFIKNYRINFIKGDITNLDELKSSMNGMDLIIHFAANPDVRKGETDTLIDLKQNVLGTYNVLESMRLNDVRDIIFSSSSTIYGEALIPTREDYGPLEPISFYGASKLAGESYISSFSHMFGIRGISFRFANVIGPRGTHGVIYDFINKLKKNRGELEILGDGAQSKSYLYIDDCIDGMLYIFEKYEKKYDEFNLGTEQVTNVIDIAHIVVKAMGLNNVRFKITGGMEGRGWKGDVKTMLLSIDKAKSFGWMPKYTSNEAVEKTAKHLVEELSWKY